MARRGQAVTISLFSFQDIITSVSGILIFITLLLALELIQSVEGDPANRVARDLDAAVDQAERERNTLKDQVRRSASDLVRALDHASTDSLASREEAEAASRSLEHEVGTLQERSLDAKHREDRVEARKFAARDDESRRDRIREDARKARDQIDRERREDRVYYTAGESSGRERWLVELGGEKIAAAPLDRPQRPVAFLGGSQVEEDAGLDRFLAWSRSDVPDAYFLILVRPSGYQRYSKVEDTFRSSRRSFGFDLIGESKKVLDDETGAGPP
ncbi:MAG: hypothetical protein JWN86_787 [Planctomycetota bacterium]|nr:hypothetical protein [Planctomycetota bacterium]